jgi:hypothetical protein
MQPSKMLPAPMTPFRPSMPASTNRPPGRPTTREMMPVCGRYTQCRTVLNLDRAGERSGPSSRGISQSYSKTFARAPPAAPRTPTSLPPAGAGRVFFCRPGTTTVRDDCCFSVPFLQDEVRHASHMDRARSLRRWRRLSLRCGAPPPSLNRHCRISEGERS